MSERAREPGIEGNIVLKAFANGKRKLKSERGNKRFNKCIVLGHKN